MPRRKEAARKPVLSSLWRGLQRHCPNCGKGKLFAGYLTVQETCTVCGHNNEQYPADDAAPYFTIFVVGHILVPLDLVVDRTWASATTAMELSIFLPATLILSLVLLPFIKGGVLGVEYAFNVVREKPLEITPVGASAAAVPDPQTHVHKAGS